MNLLSPNLQAFMAIARAKTVHAAANDMNLTQTAVTQRLKGLEGQLGTSLFTRTRRGMVLTPEGEALLHYCQSAKELEGAALARIQGAGEQTTITLGITGPNSVMGSRVIPSLQPLIAQFPQLLLQFDVQDSESRIQELRHGRAQLAIVQPTTVAAEMCSKPLQPERYMLVCSAGWSGRKLSDIIATERIVDFNSEDQLTFSYLKQFDLSAPLGERHYVNRTELMAEMLVQGFGYGVLSEEFCQPYLQRGELMTLNRGRVFDDELALAWYDRPELPAYFAAIIDAIA